MDSSEYLQLEETFSQLAELNEVERAGALLALDQTEPALASRLREMFTADQAHSVILESSASRPGTGALKRLLGEQGSGELTGVTLGPYRVLRLLGSGGMGEVYVGERTDAEVSLRVAIKILKIKWIGSRNEERFREERQSMARLRHDFIPRLLDAGTGPSQRPYYVMELVEGQPIAQACREKQLSFDDRLQLFLNVCSAVQHAHEHLLIHRDLKPANILVTATGQPALLDFGIARQFEPGTLSSSFSAEAGASNSTRIFTPEYASPEQLRGEPISTASDVYSLGVVLFELLSGRKPYDLTGKSPARVEQLICETTPPKASDVATNEGVSQSSDPAPPKPVNRAWIRRLQGDIDLILSKAIAKLPAERYATVDRLANDLRRHRQGLPIHARPPSLGYTVAKFMRRNKRPITAASLAFAALASASGMAIWQSGVARAEKRASDNATNAIENVFVARDPFQSKGQKSSTSHESGNLAALRDTAKAIDGLLEGEQKVRVLVAEGKTFRSNGSMQEAIRPLREALILQMELAYDPVQLGTIRIELAHALCLDGSLAEAKDHYLVAEGLFRKSHGRLHDRTIDAINGRGTVELADEDHEAAVQLFERALELRRASPQTKLGDLAKAYNNLAVAISSQAEVHGTEGEELKAVLDRAESLFGQVIAIRREEFGANHLKLAQPYHNLGALHYQRGNAHSGLNHILDAYDIRLASLADPDDPNAPLPSHTKIAESLYAQACFGLELHMHGLAINSARLCLEIQQQTSNHDLTWHEAETRSVLGALLLGIGVYRGAEEHLLIAVDVLTCALPKQHPHALDALERLAQLYELTGRADQAYEIRVCAQDS